MSARVLVVEDEAALRTAYQHILCREGFAVDVAKDGIVALEKLQTNPPDLILLDILMPRMDGAEFLRRANLSKCYPHTKVVAFSNLPGDDREKKIFQLGAVEHLSKTNLGPSELITAVRRFLTT